MELRHLRAFVAVARFGSFTAAARELIVTQPALSRTIQQLESALGVTLLERSTRSVWLTDRGEAFLPRAEAVLREVDAAVAEARGARQLRVGFEWALPDPWATETFERFERATGVAARLVRVEGAVAALQAGEVDVALTRRSPAPEVHLVDVPLFAEERVATVSARSPLARFDVIEFTDLGSYPLVVNGVNGSTAPDLWPAESRPREVIECSSYDEWLTLVAADRGVGTTPLSSTRTHDHSDVRYVRLRGAPPTTFHLVHRRGRDDRLVRRFVDAAQV